MNRLVCLGWISKPERKENFSFETRVAPLRTQPKLQPRFLTLSPMPLSHNGYLEVILRAQRNAFDRGGRPQSRLFAELSFHVREILPFLFSTQQRQNDINGARVTSSLQKSHISRTRNLLPYARFYLHGLFSAKCDTDLLSSSCAFTFCRSVVSSSTCFLSS